MLRERYGVAKGDRVAIAMRNYPEWSIAFWGAVAAGAIVVPLNAWWKGAELEYGLTDSGSKFLIADEQRFEELRDRWQALPLAGVAVTRARGDLPRGVARFEDLFAAGGGDVELPAIEIDPEDDATIFYTSGTTGLPKGALGTHRNICSNLTSLEFLGKQRELRLGLVPPGSSRPSSRASSPSRSSTSPAATRRWCRRSSWGPSWCWSTSSCPSRWSS